jgi:hypothetical protein
LLTIGLLIGIGDGVHIDVGNEELAPLSLDFPTEADGDFFFALTVSCP